MIVPNNRNIVGRFTVENSYVEPHSEAKACRGLIVAVLERSFRDLSPDVCAQHRREAIAWFRSKPPKSNREKQFLFQSDIPYWYCLEVLELSGPQVTFLNEKIAEAEEYQRQISLLDGHEIQKLKESIPRLSRYRRRTASPMAYELA